MKETMIDGGKDHAESDVPTHQRLPEGGLAVSCFETTSLRLLRESILRRIMRAACAVGVLGLGLALLFVRPFDSRAALLATIATAITFAATFLPPRQSILSIVYPWALVLTGAGLAWSMGPKTEPFLLAAGGLFIGALVLGGRQLAVLVGVGLVAGSSALFWSRQPFIPEVKAAWLNSLTSMLSVVLPAVIAGRMIVSALARALVQRETLVNKLVDESRSRETTLRALENARLQLTHAQKMELIGQMAGGIAHDMNNALTAIMGEASLLEDGVAAERERILESADHAAKLTRQLMVFGRRDTSQPRPLDLDATIRGLLRAIRRIIPSEVTLEFNSANRPVAVVADSTQLLQILLNLVGNAKDAMQSGGTLTMKLDIDSAMHRAILEIADTGIGIPAEVLPHVFEPFFTTKPSGKGTGLGLANVKQLVESMAGTVDVFSQTGVGTKFVVRIPLTDAPVFAESHPVVEHRGQSGTVLVVDDDVRVRAVAYTALERAGYRVLEAATVAGAVEVARESASGVDLLLTDVVMAGGGGAAAIREVTRVCPRARILVMSGYADDETLRRGIAEGDYPFIAKPFAADMLLNAVDGVLVG